MNKQDIEEYGWTAVPRGRSNVPSEQDAHTKAVHMDFEEMWPKSKVVLEAQDYAKEVLPKRTYEHSMRVYYFGYIMVCQHFPDWLSTPSIRESFFETWAMTCLFHDIGSAPRNFGETRMSFEFQGGFIALSQLQDFGAPQAQAESVAEAIIRHQDPGKSGMITRMGQLVQLATELDNMGWQPHLVSEDVIKQVVFRFPRNKWSGCFAKFIGEEMEQKPWCHTTSMEGFQKAVAENKTMKPYD